MFQPHQRLLLERAHSKMLVAICMSVGLNRNTPLANSDLSQDSLNRITESVARTFCHVHFQMFKMEIMMMHLNPATVPGKVDLQIKVLFSFRHGSCMLFVYYQCVYFKYIFIFIKQWTSCIYIAYVNSNYAFMKIFLRSECLLLCPSEQNVHLPREGV